MSMTMSNAGSVSSFPTIPSAITPQIARRTDHVALRQGELTLTYQQLGHAVAAGVARLVDLGVTDANIETRSGTHVTADITTEQAPVILIAPLGMEGTVLQLSVLFSGRVCAPLETTPGVESLTTTIRFIGGPVICLDPTMTSALTAAGISCVDVSGLTLDALLAAPSTQLVCPTGDLGADPDGAALLCFTSGSTGTPKGVLVPHSQLVEAAQFAGTGETDVAAITSPPSFFASMLQTLLALAKGGTGTYLDLNANTPAQLHDIAIAQMLNHFTGTTTHVRELAKVSLDTPITSLWGIDLGGEPTTRADLEQFRLAFPNARIRNIYGSAEAGRIATIDYSPTGELPPPGPIPAGHTDSGHALDLFDEDNQPVPSGETGRIALRLSQPFLGYWRNPELTASRILTTDDGRIWILSGDIGKFDDNGVLTVLGRTDDQVKIRGRFVNPREIDTLLLADSRIGAAITIAVPHDAPTHLRTIVVPTNPDDPSTTQPALRLMLAQALPLHALPRHIVFVDHIPTTTRGKPDMAALAELSELATAQPLPTTNSGRTIGEAAVLSVLNDLLEMNVEFTDDIFAMGADSLLAVELIEALADEFRIRISPAQLVAHPTAAKLAELMRNGLTDDTQPGLLTLFDSDHPTTAFWVLGADESFGPARLAQLTAPIRSFCTKVIGSAPSERLLRSITAIGKVNANTIEPVRSTNTVIIGYSVGTVLALETACALSRRGATPDLLILIDPPTIESITDFAKKVSLRSSLRHPRWFLRQLRKRNTELHHPFDSSDTEELVTRVVNRHTRLALKHQMIPYAGVTEVIWSDEFAAAGGTPMTNAGLTSTPTILRVPGEHGELLWDPKPLSESLLAILRSHDLLSKD